VRKIVPGATELSPWRSQYFSWINNRNEGSTEAQTLANLEFFKWLHDEYGMQLELMSTWPIGAAPELITACRRSPAVWCPT